MPTRSRLRPTRQPWFDLVRAEWKNRISSRHTAQLMSNGDQKRSALRNRVSIAASTMLIFAPILSAYAIFYRFAFNVPLDDDYHALLDFALRYRQLTTPAARLAHLLSAQHYEYKLLFEHTLVVAQLALTGHIDFLVLLHLGNLFLLPILWILWRTYFSAEPTPHRLILFLPAAFLLFSLNYAETLDWAMASLQNLPVIAFALASLHLLARRDIKSARLGAACLFAVLACSASANGFLLWPIGLAVLLASRSWTKSTLWTASFLLPVAAYLFHYQRVINPGSSSIAGKLLFWLTVTGGVAPHRLAIPAGAILLAVYAFSLRRKPSSAVLQATWLLASTLLITLGRSSLGPEAADAGRYRIYSNLLLIFAYAQCAAHLRQAPLHMNIRRSLYLATLAASILLCIRADRAAIRYFAGRNRELLQGIVCYRANPALHSPLCALESPLPPDVVHTAQTWWQLMNQATETGIYTPPPIPPNHRFFGPNAGTIDDSSCTLDSVAQRQQKHPLTCFP